MIAWKKRIYDSYMSNGFSDSHSMKKEYVLQAKYFRKNYLKYMPQNKDAKILELGCGMGQFLYFCKKEGYVNYTGIDASTEEVEYIKKTFGENVNVSCNNILDCLKMSVGGGTTVLF